MEELLRFFNTADYIVVPIGILTFTVGVLWLKKYCNIKKDYSAMFLMLLGGLTPIASLEYARNRYNSQEYKYIIYTGDDNEHIHYANEYTVNDNIIEFNNIKSDTFKVEENKYFKEK